MNHAASALGLILCSALGLLADEVRLVDGRVFDGEVMSQPGAAEVVVETHLHGMKATLHFKAADVAAITFGVSEAQKRLTAFEAKSAALAASDAQTEQPAAAWWSLAEEARALGEYPRFRELAKATIDRDPDHAAARLALGYVKQDNKWMKPADAALARGEVFFRNKWMPQAQRDMILADEEREAAATEATAARERERRLAEADVAKAEAQVAKAKAQAAQAEAEAKAARQPVQQNTTVYYGTYAPTPSIIYSPWGWNGGVGRPVIYPRPPQLPGPVCPPQPGLQVTAGGQGNGYSWGLTYR